MNALVRRAAHHVRYRCRPHRRSHADFVLTSARRPADVRGQRHDRSDAAGNDERSHGFFGIDIPLFFKREQHTRYDATSACSRRSDDHTHARVLAHHGKRVQLRFDRQWIEKRLPRRERFVEFLRFIADEFSHRQSAALAARHTVAHHLAPLAQSRQDLLGGKAVLLLVDFEKNVGEIAIRAGVFELFETLDHRGR